MMEQKEYPLFSDEILIDYGNYPIKHNSKIS